jgi:hypothetical protein
MKKGLRDWKAHDGSISKTHDLIFPGKGRRGKRQNPAHSAEGRELWVVNTACVENH